MKKINKLKVKSIHFKKKYLFNLLSKFNIKHFKKLNFFFESILRKYILYLSYNSIIINLLFNKPIFNILMELSLHKLNFILQYKFNFSNYLNSFSYFFNLHLFNNKNIELKLLTKYSNLDIFYRTNFYKLFILKYLKNLTQFNSNNWNTISFFIFQIIYFKKRTLFVDYITQIYSFFSQINIFYPEIISIIDIKFNSYYNFYFYLNSQCLRVQSNYYQYLFLSVTSFFDIFNLLENSFKRSFFSFDYCPFYLIFAKNYLQTRFFYYLCLIYYLWYEISYYLTQIIDSEFLYYGKNQTIIFTYQKNIPFFNGRTNISILNKFKAKKKD